MLVPALPSPSIEECVSTLVNVYVDLVVFTRIAGTSDYRIRSFLSSEYVHGDLCKRLGIDSSTDLDDLYSNLFLNAYINRHLHAEYLK